MRELHIFDSELFDNHIVAMHLLIFIYLFFNNKGNEWIKKNSIGESFDKKTIIEL